MFSETAPPPSNTNPGLECINVITNALGPRSVSLREMMRRATAAANRSGLDRDLGNAGGGAGGGGGNAPGPDQQPAPLHEDPIPTLSWPPETFDPTSGDEDSLMGLGGGGGAGSGGGNGGGKASAMGNVPQTSGALVSDPAERRNNALQALNTMCDALVLAPFLKDLLSAK